MTIEGDCYFVTTNTFKGRPLFADRRFAEIVVEAIQFLRRCNRIYVFAWVVMPDHFHLIVMPRGGHALPRIMHSIKSYTAKEVNRVLGRKGKIWQDNYYEHGIRGRRDLKAKLRYTLENPVRAGLTETIEDYPYSSVHFDTDV